ncbi:MAG: LysM peptidoglycan-binding domain-containing protein [Treponema sp.]|jgi:nucleoid-associated protein YgaU|nr:LysM peptidoglycan-binding domain-containing protein [Treponema sp.]
MASTIGIKIANGEFYSIIEENSSVKKRLVLTTVHDKQQSVQIDLYKSFTRTMADALYIGSVVVENIRPRPKGEPSIELVIASTAGGEITADAIDLDTSSGTGHQILNVSLKSLTEEHTEEEFPDFELEQQEGPPTSLYGKNLKIKKETEREQKKNFPILVVVLAGLLIVLVCLLIWFFLIRTRPSGSDTAPPAKLMAPEEQPVQPPPEPKVQPPSSQTAERPPEKEVPKEPPPAPALVQAPKEPPKAVESRDRSRPAPPVASYKVPSTIPKEGVPYRIRWGDTLWDIAAAFYRNPWLYPRIARFNNIRNPDLIISGTTIRIPPKN